MEGFGYTVEVNNVDSMTAIKDLYQVPATLQGCHTAIVDGYVIEGHVPVESLEKLLSERPNIIGLAVPGMPPGSPGMDGPGVEMQPYDVFAFDNISEATVYAHYEE